MENGVKCSMGLSKEYHNRLMWYLSSWRKCDAVYLTYMDFGRTFDIVTHEKWLVQLKKDRDKYRNLKAGKFG